MSLNFVSPIDPRLPFPRLPSSPRASAPPNSISMIINTNKEDSRIEKLLEKGDSVAPGHVYYLSADQEAAKGHGKWRS
ncbi:hypothetical protein LINPERPRIM_LOCUS7961 [Linum perenne]